MPTEKTKKGRKERKMADKEKTAAFDDDDRNGTGTREWSEHSLNIGTGCSHDCLYCYARENALRYKVIDGRGQWKDEKLNPRSLGRKYGRKSGVIMFPTTHDITPYYLDAAIGCLEGLLRAGNQVLVVSKPHLECTRWICARLRKHRDAMLLRFTITTTQSDISLFWEPGAPCPEERLESLAYAHAEGFQISVSMEPMLLGTEDAILTYRTVAPHVTETVWIGKMNKARQRVHATSQAIREAIDDIERLQCDKEIMRLVKVFPHKNVRWKDSIKRVLEENTPPTKAGHRT